jgi:L-asparaginase/beta-aspartyl-peptidase (threonine type)
MQPSSRPPAIVIHGGAGHDPAHADGCAMAIRHIESRLRGGEAALAIAVDAVVCMEDDGRFNAGSGAASSLDGETFERDASVMDSDGALGAVAIVRDVLNPIRLAHAVATRTPHKLVAGAGADALARVLGLPRARPDVGKAQRENAEVMQQLQGSEPVLPKSQNDDFRRLWNYAMPWSEAMRRFGGGTVGAVVRDSAGRFAVATSTGGSPPSLLGRIGDTPLVGCGFFCGPAGAIGATGIGEGSIQQMLARTVYGWIADGMDLQRALDAGVALVADSLGGGDAGLIGVTATDAASACNSRMPTARFAP